MSKIKRFDPIDPIENQPVSLLIRAGDYSTALNVPKYFRIVAESQTEKISTIKEGQKNLNLNKLGVTCGYGAGTDPRKFEFKPTKPGAELVVSTVNFEYPDVRDIADGAPNALTYIKFTRVTPLVAEIEARCWPRTNQGAVARAHVTAFQRWSTFKIVDE